MNDSFFPIPLCDCSGLNHAEECGFSGPRGNVILSDRAISMTPEEFKQKMEEFACGDDRHMGEGGHMQVDDLMCQLLRELGYGEGVQVFEESTKWYA